MALRTQPYLPLYVQDFLTDEKLAECSASTVGVYIRLMCLMHKSDPYGKILLKAKYKQNVKQIGEQNLYYSTCFALQISKNLLFSEQIVCSAIYELIEEGVLYLDGDAICQKRMVRDGEISVTRTEVGKLGGSNVTKQYGKPGYLYLMSDGYEKNKIGISVSPQNRLYRIRCDLKLPKHFKIRRQIPVSDMGASEDIAQAYFKDISNGEWLEDSYSNIEQRFVLLEANIQANTQANVLLNAESNAENEIEYENEYKSKLYLDSKEEKKENSPGEKLEAPGSMPGEGEILKFTLPPMKAEMVRELVAIVKKKMLEVPEVYQMFEAFKIQHFTGKKYYADENAIHSHFINWAKTQNYDNANSTTSASGNGSNNSKSGFNGKNGGFKRITNALRDELTIPIRVGSEGFSAEI